MGAVSETRTLVLHALRLKGVAETEAVAGLAHVDLPEAETELTALSKAGLARYRDGSLSGYQLTPAGRAAHAKALSDELDERGARRAVADAYERFLALNPELLEVCTRWQLRDDGSGPVVNDHTDARHDRAAIADLERVNHGVRPVLADLSAALDRYRRYAPLLDAAIARVRAGDHDSFTKPLIPSYHTVWFELHEDLLATLGIERASEGQD